MPGFIIAGVAKCATTTLRSILSKHPDIFIPDRELHYFSRPDFRPELYSGDISPYKDSLPGQVLGEDSPGYLVSEKAPELISRYAPEAKIIVILRDPASRTYSAYWHRVRTGRATHDFERSMVSSPYGLIEQSLYKKQIERFLQFIPREKIHFLLFEKFIKNIPGTICHLLSFIGVSTGKLDFSRINTHNMPALIPRSLTLQLIRNRLFGKRYVLGVDRLINMMNPKENRKPPPMNPVTRMLLNAYFARENKGINELVGLDMESYWYKNNKD